MRSSSRFSFFVVVTFISRDRSDAFPRPFFFCSTPLIPDNRKFIPLRHCRLTRLLKPRHHNSEQHNQRPHPLHWPILRIDSTVAAVPRRPLPNCASFSPFPKSQNAFFPQLFPAAKSLSLVVLRFSPVASSRLPPSATGHPCPGPLSSTRPEHHGTTVKSFASVRGCLWSFSPAFLQPPPRLAHLQFYSRLPLSPPPLRPALPGLARPRRPSGSPGTSMAAHG